MSELSKLLCVLTLALGLAACGKDLSAGSADEPTGGNSSDQQVERICGGIAGIACADGEYCRHADGSCHIADGQGVCEPRPQMCTKDYRPVCGCDGKTYGNACTAASAGVSVNHQGACEKTG